MPLHRFAGTIRRNKHRDDRAHGRLQNPLAQNDVRAGEPSRRWEARWNKWKGQWAEIRDETRFEVRLIGAESEVVDYPLFDTRRAELEAFAAAAEGGPAYPLPLDQAIHGIAVFEAVTRSAKSGRTETTGT